MDWFSRALAYEYKDQGIIVQSLVPSYIATNLVRFSSFLQRPSFIVPDPERFVKSAIQTIGVSDRTTGFWSHGIQVSITHICFIYVGCAFLSLPSLFLGKLYFFLNMFK